MGEKGNGGHVATGGARAVRQATTDMGLGGSPVGGDAASGGGGFFSDLASDAKDHATDIGGAVVNKREHPDED